MHHQPFASVCSMLYKVQSESATNTPIPELLYSLLQWAYTTQAGWLAPNQLPILHSEQSIHSQSAQ
jgi:hypothetical protein